jgi:Antitoxin ParD
MQRTENSLLQTHICDNVNDVQETFAMSRLTIDITDQQHQSIKAMAAIQGKTIKEYAIERLFSLPSDEERALGELRVLLEQRMTEASRGEVLTQSLTEIADDAMKVGGIA